MRCAFRLINYEDFLSAPQFCKKNQMKQKENLRDRHYLVQAALKTIGDEDKYFSRVSLRLVPVEGLIILIILVLNI